MAELIDLHKEFHLGNNFILRVASELSTLLDNSFRVVIKYDSKLCEIPNDDKLNILFCTSRETHNISIDSFNENVFLIFQNYHALDNWGYPIYNAISHPMPIGTFVECDDIEIKPLPDRKYDFVFAGQIPHTGTRDKFKRCLEDMLRITKNNYKYEIIYTNSFSGGLNPKEYLQLLNDSKICLCPQGAFSDESFRFFECLRMGSFPMVERLPKFWYYEQAPILWTNWQFLDKSLAMALNHLNSKKCIESISKLIDYNLKILNPKNLAIELYSIIKNRKNNIPNIKEFLGLARKELSELYSHKL